MSYSTSSEEYFWDDKDWITDEEEDRRGGDEEGKEGEGPGEGHHVQPLQHQMIFTRQVSDENVTMIRDLDTGPLSEYPSPLSEHSGSVELYMMGGKQLVRTPPETGGSELGRQGADVGLQAQGPGTQVQGGQGGPEGPGGQAQSVPTLGAGATSKINASLVATPLSTTSGGTPVGSHKKVQKKALARCHRCKNCKQSSCPGRGDPYICFSCLAKQSCALRPACVSLSREETKIWHQQVVERNNALIGKRTDFLWHKVDIEVGQNPETMQVAIVKDKTAKPRVYPNISPILEEEAGTGQQDGGTGRLAEQEEISVEEETGEDKLIEILKQFKLEKEKRHAEEIDQLKGLFAQHLEEQNRMMQQLVRANDHTVENDEDADDEEDGQDGDQGFKYKAPQSQKATPSAPPPPHPPRPLFAPPRPAFETPVGRPVESQIPAGTPGDQAMLRLASALEKRFDTPPPKTSARLPALVLPTLQLVGGQPVGCAFWSWKQKTLNFFESNDIADSMAVHLIQTEKSLPKKWAASISNCISVAEIFQVLETQNPSKDSVLPSLIKDLTEMSSAYTNTEQLDLCDRICRILVQVQSHFPSRELTQSELTSTLSAFQSQHEISLLPALLKQFKSEKLSTGKSFVELLFNYCSEKRSDLHSILAALHQYRRDDPLMHQNIGLGGGRGRGGGRS